MKDVLVATFGRNGPFGGVKFDEVDDSFDNQPVLNLLPRILVMPFETLINICTFNLSETNKDLLIDMLVNACCEGMEHFIKKVRLQR